MPRRTDTKQRIERAALGLFVEHGIVETSTKQIAKAVGLSDGALYRHFESKDEIAHTLFDQQHVMLAEALEEAQSRHSTIDDKARAITEAYCTMADRDWSLFTYHHMNGNRFLGQYADNLANPVDVVARAIQEAMDAGEIKPGNADLLAAMALGVVLQVVTFKMFGRITEPLTNFKDTLTNGVIAVLHAND